MRKKILANFLNCSENKIFKGDYNNHSYTDTKTDYLVFTEEEANQAAQKQVWSFIHVLDTDLLIKHLGTHRTKEKIARLLTNHCDNCLLILASLIIDYDLFAQEAISKYGRAYFLCFEDKTEYKTEYCGQVYYIYRLL